MKSTTTHNQERTYSGIAITERTAQRRQAFIDAGIELFGTSGYQATNMRTLVAATGLTNRYFYESFDNMEALLIACYEHLIERFKEQLTEQLESAENTYEAKIRAGVSCFFTAMADNHFARITHSEVLGVSSQVDKVYHRHMSEFASLMMSYLIVSDRQEQSAMMPYVGAGLIGAIMHSGIAWARQRNNVPVSVAIEATVNIFIGTFKEIQPQ